MCDMEKHYSFTRRVYNKKSYYILHLLAIICSFSKTGSVLCGVGKDSHNKNVSFMELEKTLHFDHFEVYMRVVNWKHLYSYRWWSYGTQRDVYVEVRYNC